MEGQTSIPTKSIRQGFFPLKNQHKQHTVTVSVFPSSVDGVGSLDPWCWENTPPKYKFDFSDFRFADGLNEVHSGDAQMFDDHSRSPLGSGIRGSHTQSGHGFVVQQ